MAKLNLNEQAKEILEIAERHGVEQNFFFITTFKRYQVQIGILIDLEKTIKVLRERAGVTYKKPSEIGKDPNFSDFGYEISENLQEIRRERRSELALQGFRFDDLMRWGAHKLIVNQRGRGAYLGEDGVLYKSFNTSKQETVDALKRVLVDNEKWMDPLQALLPNGYQFNPKRDYLLPISPDELALNKKLKQNPGWE